MHYSIALGPRAGQKVLSPQTVHSRQADSTQPGCVSAHGCSLHAAVRCGAHQRKELERLCRYITRPAIANERLKRNRAGQVVLHPRASYDVDHVGTGAATDIEHAQYVGLPLDCEFTTLDRF